MNGLGAILLAGGRGSRMGGVRKPLLDVGGVTLLDAAIAAARTAGADPIVLVGPPDDAHADLVWVREDPPYGGPVAAVLTALPLVTAPVTLVLACDLPRVADAVQVLRAESFAGDGVCLADPAGRPQWLTGIYRTDALRDAARTIGGGGRDASVRALLGGLTITPIAASADLAADVDTWDDLTEARQAEARRRNP